MQGAHGVLGAAEVEVRPHARVATDDGSLRERNTGGSRQRGSHALDFFVTESASSSHPTPPMNFFLSKGSEVG